MKYQAFAICIMVSMCFLSCDRTEIKEPSTGKPFGYADSIIYMQATPGDHIVHPLQWHEGTYSAYPEGLNIDAKTGAINVSKSETGLRYLVKFKDDFGRVFTTKVVMAGINYPDHYHNLASGDSMARIIYNADPDRTLPAGNIFDDGLVANATGLAVATSDGSINLAKTVRNGLFGANPKNGVYLDINVPYRINDKSANALNSIKVRLYYYQKMSDIPAELKQLLTEREQSYIRVMNTGSKESAYAKPRPPCVIIVGA